MNDYTILILNGALLLFCIQLQVKHIIV